MKWFRRGEERHEFTPQDREAQLAELELHCDDLAELFANHGDRFEADQFRARANGARALLGNGFNQTDLNELGGSFPSGPDWLNPKYADFNGPREPWQDEVARLHALAAAVAIDLRAVATMYQR